MNLFKGKHEKVSSGKKAVYGVKSMITWRNLHCFLLRKQTVLVGYCTSWRSQLTETTGEKRDGRTDTLTTFQRVRPSVSFLVRLSLFLSVVSVN